MRRRELIIGGVALALPRAARAQQSPIPLIGYLQRFEAGSELLANGFRLGLKEMGFIEGQTVSVEHRWPEAKMGMEDIAADLVRRRAAVIFGGFNAGALAARAATSEVPIVFVVGLDPVLMGLVSSISHPGGNATGVSFQASALEPKRFELLRVLLPRMSLVGALINPDNPNAGSHAKDLQSAASAFGLQLLVVKARDGREIDAAFATLIQQRAGGLLVTSDPLFDGQRRRLVELAARNAIPTMYPWRDFTDTGGLMSYGNSLIDAYRQAGLYAGRILKGDKPANLPVWQPSRFEFVINLKTAMALGMTIPSTLLTFADEVIE